MEKFKIVSPTHNRPYTVKDALDKLLKRRQFHISKLKVIRMEKCSSYGDRDYLIDFEAETIPSTWSDTIDVKIHSLIPIHETNSFRFKFGGFESCVGYNEKYIGVREKDAHQWETKISIALGDSGEPVQRDSISFTWHSLEEERARKKERPYDEQIDIQNEIVDIVKKAIIQSFLLLSVEEWDDFEYWWKDGWYLQRADQIELDDAEDEQEENIKKSNL